MGLFIVTNLGDDFIMREKNVAASASLTQEITSEFRQFKIIADKQFRDVFFIHTETAEQKDWLECILPTFDIHPKLGTGHCAICFSREEITYDDLVNLIRLLEKSYQEIADAKQEIAPSFPLPRP